MGSIDLDPASCDFANTLVKASSFFTKEQNGLEQEWLGNVFLNPPYSQGLFSKFVDKLLKSQGVEQYIVLTNNNTETKSGQQLAKDCSSVCLVQGRVKFIKPTGEENKSPLQGQVIYYKGSNTDKFNDCFSKLGVVFKKG